MCGRKKEDADSMGRPMREKEKPYREWAEAILRIELGLLGVACVAVVGR